jgi:luciferase-like monooxygenase
LLQWNRHQRCRLQQRGDINIFIAVETEYTKVVSEVDMKSRAELHRELRRRILSLPDVTERQNAGIHEDAFFVGRTMFMHIHGHGHCDIRLAKSDQARVLAEGKAHPHRWAPEKGYVTFLVRDESDLAPAMELIRMSYDHFAAEQRG